MGSGQSHTNSLLQTFSIIPGCSTEKIREDLLYVIRWKRLYTFGQKFFNFDIFINFDTNATSNVYQCTLEVYNRFQIMPNIHNTYNMIVKKYLELYSEYLQTMALMFNANRENFIFTSGASESNNTAIQLITKGLEKKFGNKCVIITSPIEHKCLLYACQSYTGKVVYLKPEKYTGHISSEQLEEEIKSAGFQKSEPYANNFMVSLMSVNNETGMIYNIRDFAKIVHQYGGIFHTDATQWIGKVNIQRDFLPTEMYIDAFSLSFHKIGGLIGSGLLYINKSVIKCEQENVLIHGTQQDGLRGGTVNPGLVLSSIVSLIKSQENREAKNRALNKYYIYFIENIFVPILKPKGIQLLNHFSSEVTQYNYVPSTVLLSLGENYCAEDLAKYFGNGITIDSVNYIISIGLGSACNTENSIGRSYVMDALGIENINIIRISWYDIIDYRDFDILGKALKHYLTQVDSIR